MTTTLDATVGGPAANSYVASVAEATALIDATPYITAWLAVVDEDDDESMRYPPRLLVRARAILDLLSYTGQATQTTQGLPHPRANMPHPSGWDWDANVIAAPMKYAQALLAGWLASRPATEVDPFGENASAAIESVTAGPVTVNFRDPAAAPAAGPDFLQRAVVAHLAAYGIVESGSRVRLVR